MSSHHLSGLWFYKALISGYEGQALLMVENIRQLVSAQLSLSLQRATACEAQEEDSGAARLTLTKLQISSGSGGCGIYSSVF